MKVYPKEMKIQWEKFSFYYFLLLFKRKIIKQKNSAEETKQEREREREKIANDGNKIRTLFIVQ